MRHVATDGEKKLWRLLRSRQLEEHKFRRQVPIGNFIADFVCHERKIIIEVDGGQHADNAKDVARDLWFANAGYRVLRYWNNDVPKNPSGVLEAILSELTASSVK
jgi:very-short-patch-repair endonuclease